PDNIRAFEENGAEIRYFSPLQDAGLPDDLDAVYLPGGYPEEHAKQLAANSPMKTSLKDFAGAGGTVYGECGGLMYLGTALTDRDGHSHSMTGIIPIKTRCLTKFKRLGYTEVNMQSNTLWGPAGTTLRGHEFHYSEIISDELDARNWKRGYNVAMRRDADKHTEGYTKGNILGSYIHLHWAANPTAVKHFITRCCKRTE
ncbi:MAG: cobyrinic acid a,c-diamide synthase, partial [Deltaproteobacteria bacterium]|nr:cobyrinic acid a,c-diamide synthase [Deltaproteobacteria bacterium]